MKFDLSSLPPDCLRLVLSKVDYGSNKQLVWALSGSGKAIRQALRDCPAEVQLSGHWSRSQLADLVLALPEMTSLSMHPDYSLSFETLSPEYPELAVQEFWLLSSLLGRSKIRHLDLRRIKPVVQLRIHQDHWFHLTRNSCLPEGLEHLALPDLRLTQSGVERVNELAGLTSLHCSLACFWPALSLIGLKDLSMSIPGQSFNGNWLYLKLLDELDEFKGTFSQFTNLTRLDLNVCEKAEKTVLTLPSSIQELRLSGRTGHLAHLAPSLTNLQGLTSLQLADTHVNHVVWEAEDMVDLSGMSFQNLRELMVARCMRLPILNAPHVTRLSLEGRGRTGCLLCAGTIAQACTMTSIRSLEIAGWSSWDSVERLACLPHLTHVTTDLGLPLLRGLLKPGCLEKLEVMTLRVCEETAQLATMQDLFAVRVWLLSLPALRLLILCHANQRDSNIGLLHALEALGLSQGEKWRCLHSEVSEGQARLYARV